jgi:demethylmenaquinone methyltransferase/2-methoxy-6-polyprenyl-1,4-benzoquinol methylase
MKEEGPDPSAEDLLSSQRAYYDLRAPDYASVTAPADRRTRSLLPGEVAASLIDELEPSGDALELACGPGMFTRELARHARSVTAVDASVHMLARSRDEVADSKVRYIQGDVFTWAPDRVYDIVFFGFWLSHVPPTMFEQFWSLVRSCLSPDGRVAFVDEDDRGAALEDVRLVAGVPSARRTLSDGRQFDIVKVYWEPAHLRARLAELGFDIRIRRVGETCMYGVGRATGSRPDRSR